MVKFSDAVIESMGFRRLAEGVTIRAHFHHVQVFAIEGVEVRAAVAKNAVIKGHSCRIAFGPDLNELSQLLLARDYVQDMAEWQREKSWSGPYLVTLLGPTDEYIMSGGHALEDADGGLTVFDGFPQACAALDALADRLLPEIVTAVCCQFQTPGKLRRIRPLQTATPGTTDRGQHLQDFRLTFSARATSLETWSIEEVQRRLTAAGEMAGSLPEKVARHFKWAQYETDNLKRFLYFFLVLELYTHVAFEQIDHAKQAKDMVFASSLARKSAADLLNQHTKQMRDLRGRFIWCAMSFWPWLDDADIDQFGRLKKIRDNIVHGHINEPPAEAVAAIELLTVKVLLQKRSK